MSKRMSRKMRLLRLPTRLHGVFPLGLIAVVVGIVWLVVLPRLSQQPQIAARRQWLQDKKINLAAMYYTEVEALETTLKRMDRRSNQIGPTISGQKLANP